MNTTITTTISTIEKKIIKRIKFYPCVTDEKCLLLMDIVDVLIKI